MSEPLPIIGRERALVRRVTRQLLDAMQRRHEWKDPVELRRGESFELAVLEPDGTPTNRVVRVTVEMLGVLEPEQVKP